MPSVIKADRLFSLLLGVVLAALPLGGCIEKSTDAAGAVSPCGDLAGSWYVQQISCGDGSSITPPAGLSLLLTLASGGAGMMTESVTDGASTCAKTQGIGWALSGITVTTIDAAPSEMCTDQTGNVASCAVTYGSASVSCSQNLAAPTGGTPGTMTCNRVGDVLTLTSASGGDTCPTGVSESYTLQKI